MTKHVFRHLIRVSKVVYSPKYLLATNILTGVVSVAVGDCLQQRIEVWLDKHKDSAFDGRRNVRMMSCGVYFGVFGHFWYDFLDRRFPGKSGRSVLKKLVCELAMGPPLVSGVFLLVASLRGSTLEESFQQLRTQFKLICAVEWLVFIPLQTVNFRLVSPRFRYLFVAVVSVAYDAFLSFVIHRKQQLIDCY